MVGIVTATKLEASVIIQTLNLKKTSSKPFVVYENSNFCLIISNIGILNASIATTFLLTNKKIKKIVNFGVAGSSIENSCIGEIYEIEKVYYESAKIATFSLNHFKTAPLKSQNHPATKSKKQMLFDMEGFGYFVASKKFLEKESIFLLKMVSDFLDIEGFDKNLISKKLQESNCILRDYFQKISAKI
jgi:nucleoside phosphorylase